MAYTMYVCVAERVVKDVPYIHTYIAMYSSYYLCGARSGSPQLIFLVFKTHLKTRTIDHNNMYFKIQRQVHVSIQCSYCIDVFIRAH